MDEVICMYNYLCRYSNLCTVHAHDSCCTCTWQLQHEANGLVPDEEVVITTHAAARRSVQLLQRYFVEQGVSDANFLASHLAIMQQSSSDTSIVKRCAQWHWSIYAIRLKLCNAATKLFKLTWCFCLTTFLKHGTTGRVGVRENLGSLLTKNYMCIHTHVHVSTKCRCGYSVQHVVRKQLSVEEWKWWMINTCSILIFIPRSATI